eukprot:6183916-Pleurochrysis_carterae.AAC.2
MRVSVPSKKQGEPVTVDHTLHIWRNNKPATSKRHEARYAPGPRLSRDTLAQSSRNCAFANKQKGMKQQQSASDSTIPAAAPPPPTL